MLARAAGIGATSGAPATLELPLAIGLSPANCGPWSALLFIEGRSYNRAFMAAFDALPTEILIELWYIRECENLSSLP